MKARLLLLGALVLAATLTACIGAPALPPASSPGLPTDTPGAATHTLTTADSGTTQTLHIGETLVLELSADRRWAEPTVDTTILQVQPGPTPAAGAPARWTYKAAATGQTMLTSQGACLPNPGGPTCASIILYTVTITVTP